MNVQNNTSNDSTTSQPVTDTQSTPNQTDIDQSTLNSATMATQAPSSNENQVADSAPTSSTPVTAPPLPSDLTPAGENQELEVTSPSSGDSSNSNDSFNSDDDDVMTLPVAPTTNQDTQDYVDSYQAPVGEEAQPDSGDVSTSVDPINNYGTPVSEEQAQKAKELDEKLEQEIQRLEKMVQDLEAQTPPAQTSASSTPASSTPASTAPASTNELQAPASSSLTTDEESEPTSLSTQAKSGADNSTNSADTELNVPASSNKSSEPATESEALEDQNIFVLLGLENSDDAKKEKFLDELQQVIWEEFLESDLPTLVNAEQKAEVDKILQNTGLTDIDKQEQVLAICEKTVPNLEDLMVKKALELKQDLVLDRVKGMQDTFSQDQASLTKLDEATQQFQQGNWRSGAKILNDLRAKPAS